MELQILCTLATLMPTTFAMAGPGLGQALHLANPRLGNRRLGRDGGSASSPSHARPVSRSCQRQP